MPYLNREEASALIKRRSREWYDHEKRWRFLYDSLEGGQRYRYNNYVHPPLSLDEPRLWFWHGYDVQTSAPQTLRWGQYGDMNLVPHLSEMDLRGQDLYAQRLERTPVPMDLKRVIQRHIARVFSKEVRRNSPEPRLEAWWRDVDGAGTDMDGWIRKTVAPLLLALGQLDLCFDHPAPPPGVEIRTRADALEYGLDACVASILLPENVPWWWLDPRTRRYEQVLIFERFTDMVGNVGARWRHWTATDSNAYDDEGNWLPEVSRSHRFGAPPILRVFDERKARCANVGQGRYEEVAELQKARYNSQSELTLGDIQQSHANLSGPQEMCEGTEIQSGPGGVLPKFRKPDGSYEGWEYVDPPKGAQQEIRQHIQDFKDDINVVANLSKPAGATTRGAVAQSGVSKVMDDQSLVDTLSEVSACLQDAERALLPYVLAVLGDGRRDAPKVAATVAATLPTLVYPKEFNLQGATDMADAAAEVSAMAEGAGRMPETEKEVMKKYVSLRLPGLPDARLTELHAEVDDVVDAAAARHQQRLEGLPARRDSEGEEDEGDVLPPGAMGGDGPAVQTGAGDLSTLWESPEPA